MMFKLSKDPSLTPPYLHGMVKTPTKVTELKTGLSEGVFNRLDPVVNPTRF